MKVAVKWNRKKRREQLACLWRWSRACHWCGCETVLVQNIGPKRKTFADNEATLDHLDSRWSNERGKHRGEFRRVLACRKCNQARGRAEVLATRPQEIWARSNKFYDIAKRSGALNEVTG